MEQVPFKNNGSVSLPRKDVPSNASTVLSSDCVKLLVKSGADVNKATMNGWTALHLASLDGYVDAVKSLLDLGANVNATSAINWTPLIGAIVGNHYQCAQALIRAGANVNVMVQIWHSANWEAKTALGFAVDLDTVDIVQLLLHYGVQVDHMSFSNCTNLELCKLLKVAGDASYSMTDTNTSEYVRIKNGKCATWPFRFRCRSIWSLE